MEHDETKRLSDRFDSINEQRGRSMADLRIALQLIETDIVEAGAITAKQATLIVHLLRTFTEWHEDAWDSQVKALGARGDMLEQFKRVGDFIESVSARCSTLSARIDVLNAVLRGALHVTTADKVHAAMQSSNSHLHNMSAASCPQCGGAMTYIGNEDGGLPHHCVVCEADY